MSLYAKYGLNEQEVLEWAKKHYPQFIGNKNIIAQLYLKLVKGVQVDPRSLVLLTGKKVNVADLRVGEWSIIEVLVGVRTRQSAYQGCPVCFRSTQDGLCPQCGKTTPQVMIWEEYLAGDSSGEVILTLPPRITSEGKNYEGTVLRVKGVLRDSGEFMAQAVQEVTPRGVSPAPAPEVPKAKPQAPPQEIPKEPPVRVQEEIPKVEVGDEALEREARDLQKILEVFGEVPYDDLVMWHKSRKLVTPLDVLINAVGMREGSVVKRR